VRLLAIDTSAESCSVGVAVPGASPVLRSVDAGRTHAERLMPLAAEAMAEAGLAFADLDRIAVTIGPGSFTGVRIGVAAARGLALATGAATVGIGTLAVHAAEAAVLAAGPVVVAIAAGRGDIYVQRFGATGAAETPPEVGPPAAFAAVVDGRAVLCGSGADALNAAAGTRNLVVHRRTTPSIVALLRLATIAPPQDEAPKPLYLRPPDAKPQTQAQVARR
jgi:tRNA threonylcarbamoyl adenosine modification protein YeaZ